LKDYNNWGIDGEEKYLDINCIKLKGRLGFTGKSGDNNFNVLVDKNTGIVLKFEALNSKGEVVRSLVTKNIKINGPIDTKLFEKDTKNYIMANK